MNQPSHEFAIYDVERQRWLDMNKSGIISIYTHEGRGTAADYYDGQIHNRVVVFQRVAHYQRVYGAEWVSPDQLAYLEFELHEQDEHAKGDTANKGGRKRGAS